MKTPRSGLFHFSFVLVACHPGKTDLPRSEPSTTLMTLVVPTKRRTLSQSTIKVHGVVADMEAETSCGCLDFEQQGRPPGGVLLKHRKKNIPFFFSSGCSSEALYRSGKVFTAFGRA